jgi:hypothetical protein
MMQLNALLIFCMMLAWWQSCYKQSDGLCVGGHKYGISIFLSTLD